MSKSEVTIVDYGLGNLRSVSQAVAHVGASPVISSDPEEIRAAEKIILPGVGAFSVAMNFLQQLGLDVALKQASSKGTPLLGICLGMQLLFDESDEFGQTPGLGLLGGRVTSVTKGRSDSDRVRKTHIGWRTLSLSPEGETDSLLGGVTESDSFYFVHSYGADCAKPNQVLATVAYGEHRFAAAVGAENVVGVQFHPEKSGSAGLRILENFCEK